MTQTSLSLLWTHYRFLSLPKVIKFPPQEPEIKSIPAFTTFFPGPRLFVAIESSPMVIHHPILVQSARTSYPFLGKIDTG